MPVPVLGRGLSLVLRERDGEGNGEGTVGFEGKDALRMDLDPAEGTGTGERSPPARTCRGN